MVFLPESIQFMVELLLAECLFLTKLRRRENFVLRLAAGLALLTLFSVAWPSGWTGFVKVFKYLGIYGLSAAVLWQTFEMSLWEAVFIGSAAYAVQHIAYNLGIPLFLYSHFPDTELGKIFFYASILGVYVLVYGTAYRLLGQNLRLKGLRSEQNRGLILFLIAMLTLVVVLNYVRFMGGDSLSPILHLALIGYAILGCVFALFIQFFLVQHLTLWQKLEVSEQLLHNQQEQFHIAEETIECINLKCHDLKYQLMALRQNTNDPTVSKALQDVENSVMIYDAYVQTGNEALDVILTEKSLICEKNGITLTCMADGGILKGISSTDLYAIFGNLLDNAIESVSQLSDPEQRVIGLTVQKQGNLALIHAENYFDHPICMENGLPETTKEDPRFHGFGLRSIQMLAEKYDGSLSVSIDGNIFALNVLLPIKEA